MWQRFTERARKIVFYAQEEAQRFGEGYVSTEHLLLGLTREPGCCAAVLLTRLGVSLEHVRSEVERQLPRGHNRPNQDMTLTPRAKRVIDLAYDEARGLNHNYIGSEHLLLGLVREGDGLAGRILAKLEVDLHGLREERAKLDPGPESDRLDPGVASPAYLGLSSVRMTTELVECVIRSGIEAKRRGVGESEPDDLLLVLLSYPTSVGHKVLVDCGLNPPLLAEQLASTLGQGASAFQGDVLPSAATRKLLEDADSFRNFMGHSRTGTHHVIHAILYGATGAGYDLLRENGIDESRVASAIRDLGSLEPDRPPKAGRPPIGQAFAAERILLLILGTPPEQLSKALRSSNVSPLVVSDALINFFQRPPVDQASPNLHTILEKANDLQHENGHGRCTEMHLLAAILDLGDSFAAETLIRAGLSVTDLLPGGGQ